MTHVVPGLSYVLAPSFLVISHVVLMPVPTL